MSIPTNNLYNFVAQALENQYRIKYFYPYGQKMFKNLIDNIEDEDPYEKPREQNILLCHDQEPLDLFVQRRSIKKTATATRTIGT